MASQVLPKGSASAAAADARFPIEQCRRSGQFLARCRAAWGPQPRGGSGGVGKRLRPGSVLQPGVHVMRVGACVRACCVRARPQSLEAPCAGSSLTLLASTRGAAAKAYYHYVIYYHFIPLCVYKYVADYVPPLLHRCGIAAKLC